MAGSAPTLFAQNGYYVQEETVCNDSARHPRTSANWLVYVEREYDGAAVHSAESVIYNVQERFAASSITHDRVIVEEDDPGPDVKALSIDAGFVSQPETGSTLKGEAAWGHSLKAWLNSTTRNRWRGRVGLCRTVRSGLVRRTVGKNEEHADCNWKILNHEHTAVPRTLSRSRTAHIEETG